MKSSFPKKVRLVLVERYLVFYREELYRRLSVRYNTSFLYSGERLGDLPELAEVDRLPVHCFAMRVKGRRKIVWMSILFALLKTRPEVVISEISISLVSTWILFILRPLLKFRLLFWGHGMEDYWQSAPRITIADRIRLLWFRWSDGVIVYGKRGLKELKTFLPSHPNLVRSPNAQNSDLQHQCFERLSNEGRIKIRADLGISGFAFVYIGRLVDGKGLERLPALAEYLKSRGSYCEFHFIGSGNAEKGLQQDLAEIGIKTVFHGTLTEESMKGRILFASDCLIGPGPMGLAVVDALGYGCPVLTLGEKNFLQKHGPEIEYIENGISGFILPSVEEWQDRAFDLTQDMTLLSQLRVGATKVFQSECLISNQFNGACEAIDRSISNRRLV